MLEIIIAIFAVALTLLVTATIYTIVVAFIEVHRGRKAIRAMRSEFNEAQRRHPSWRGREDIERLHRGLRDLK